MIAEGDKFAAGSGQCDLTSLMKSRPKFNLFHKLEIQPALWGPLKDTKLCGERRRLKIITHRSSVFAVPLRWIQHEESTPLCRFLHISAKTGMPRSAESLCQNQRRFDGQR